MLPLKKLRVGALKVSFALTFASFLLVFPAVMTLPAAAEVLATVNGKAITDEDLKLAAEDLGDGVPKQLEGKAREAYLLDYVIDATLVAQKAAADKFDQDPDFSKKLAYYHDKVLMESLLTKIAKDAVTPQKLQETYDQAAKAQKPETEIHARHILVDSEAEAQAALKRVKGGEDFAKVAKEVSKDASADGGDLGWFTKDRMVPEFADAAFKLDVGQVSDPVKSQFGWHIIKVEGKRQTSFPPFDQVKKQVTAYVIQKAQTDLLEQLHKDAKIEKTSAAPTDTPAPGGANAPASDTPQTQTPAPTSSPAPASPAPPADKK